MRFHFLRLLGLRTVLASATTLLSSRPLNLTSLFAPNRVTFADAVASGVFSTTARYPSAVFVEVQATTMMNPTSNPRILTDVRLIFSVPGLFPHHVILVQMKRNAWGQWGEPFLSRTEPPRDSGAMPIPLGMDLLEADHLMKRAGYAQKYWGVDVRWPLSQSAASAQVFYLFQMVGENPDGVIVGAKDRSVKAVVDAQQRDAWLGH